MKRRTLNVRPWHVIVMSECSPVRRRWSLGISLILLSIDLMDLVNFSKIFVSVEVVPDT